MIRHFFENILKIIFPNKCLGCLKYSDQLICQNCFNTLNINKYFICPKCHKQFDNTKNLNCLDNDLHFQAILYSLNYQDTLTKDLIHKFKYQNLKSLSYVFKNILTQSLNHHKKFLRKNHFLIIPVPLHKEKEKLRGFNQSIILSKLISRIIYSKTINNALIRYKNNPPQAKSKNNLQRQQNVLSIFKINNHCKKYVKNKNIILVDDVFTTGATLNECAKILKQNGAKIIIAICLAR